MLYLAAPAVDVGQRANRREVFRRRAQHLFKLGRRFIVGADLDERAAECDPRRDVGGMPQESGAAGVDGIAELPEAAYSSASAAKEIDAGSRWTRRRNSSSLAVSVMSVACYGMIVTAVAALVVDRPRLSVTVSVT